MKKEKTFFKLQQEISDHYSSGYENSRLTSGTGSLELERTHELLKRFLPPSPAKILDIGGGTGVYAYWLSKQGYQVHLIDIVPLHIQLALKKAEERMTTPLASAIVGDARKLEMNDESFDATLMFGPLYHLTEKEDRISALKEAYRVLRKDGVFMAVGISRYASLFDGIRSEYLDDPDFFKIVEQDLQNGQHKNPTEKKQYFMDTFFHHPNELVEEVSKTGFQEIEILGIEGPCWLIKDSSILWTNQESKNKILSIVRNLEKEKSLIGASSHLMIIGKKK